MRREPRLHGRRHALGVRNCGARRETPCAGSEAMIEPTPEATVSGERDSTVLRQPVSAQSRVSNFLALGLMSVLGLGMLTWYYAHALTRQSRAQRSAQSLSNKRASGDAPLPSLGKIEP